MSKKDNTKHTPGPWHLEPEAYDNATGEFEEPTIWGAPDSNNFRHHVAIVRIGLRESEANARLIAAAPDLLAACKRALPYLVDHVAMTLEEGPGDRLAYDACEAAIEKAEGAQ